MSAKSSIGLALTLLPVIAHGARILFYTGGIATSNHRAALDPLANKLADRGHNVTFFSPFKSQNEHPNVTNFCPDGLQENSETYMSDFIKAALRSRFKSKYRVDTGRASEMFDAGVSLCELTLRSKQFQEWVNVSRFDLVVVDKSSQAECGYALAYKFKAKIIGLSATTGILPWDVGLYGLPAEASWIPSHEVFYDSKDMGFFPRLFSELSGVLWHLAYLSILPKYDRLARSLLNVPDMPPMEEVIRSESLIFASIHYSDYYAKSLPPFIIPVGGMHLTESSGVVSNETYAFLKEGGDAGFVYVNFGNPMTTAEMPQKLVKIFFDAFRRLKFRILWEWHGQPPKDVPVNVLLKEYLPQNDVLAHPKILAFITHGEQISMQNAIFHGVPVIVFPVCGDHDFNAKRVRRMGNGIELEFYELTSDRLISAIKTLAEDPRYPRMAKIHKAASRIRETSPLGKAVWWTEYVLVQDESVLQLLKPLSTTQPWWMVKALDVWGFILVVFFGISAVLITSLYKVYKLFMVPSCGNKSKAD